EYDIIALQEPHINFLRNTRANHRWHVLYPSHHHTSPQTRTRACIFVNMSLDTNHWKQIPFPSSDVVIVQPTSPFGTCTILNIY
ncbi:hypothetical protein BDR03DRAFT_803293, partial [Suillus americanus]